LTSKAIRQSRTIIGGAETWIMEGSSMCDKQVVTNRFPLSVCRWLYAPSIIAGLIVAAVLSADAQSTSFTYQGLLQDGGNPANGTYDLQFRLFDSLTNGNQIASTLISEDVTVTNGIFGVSLDFGAAAFPGAARWLETAVRPGASTGSFTTLSPRQPITATPYAMQSLNAATAANALQLGSVAAGQYVLTGDSRLSNARPPTAGSTNYIQNTTNLQTGSNFNISGNGMVGGTLSTTYMGVGTAVPGAQLEAKGPGDPVMLVNHSGGTGNPALWLEQDGTPKSYIWWDQATDRFNLGTAFVNPQISLHKDGSVGIGTSLTNAKLDVDGVDIGTGVRGTGSLYGLYGLTTNGIAVYGYSSSGTGIFASSGSSYGLYASSGSSYAAFFGGSIYLTGVVTQQSDERLKQQISGLRYGLHEVLRLRPVTWIWKEKVQQGPQLGLIAQEVETVLPELVTTAQDAEQTKGINYIGLVPVTIKAIQEQQGQIEQQQLLIKQQQRQIDGLKALVCSDHPTAIICQ
jgi:Chaperone of endosialidase